jgi:hypothetical protein
MNQILMGWTHDTYSPGLVRIQPVYTTKDLLDLMDSSNLLKIGWIRNPRFKTNLDLWSTNQHKSLKVRIRDQQCETNRKTNPQVHNSLIRFSQP